MPSPLLIREVLYLSINLAAGGGGRGGHMGGNYRKERQIRLERERTKQISTDTLSSIH
jgi:hypothetical protein